MITLTKAAPVILGAFVLGASVGPTGDPAFQSAFPRGSRDAAQCGAGKSRGLCGPRGFAIA